MFFKTIADFVLEFLFGKVMAWYKEREAEKKRRAEIDAAAKASVQPLKDAKTGEEIDKATHSALDGL